MAFGKPFQVSYRVHSTGRPVNEILQSTQHWLTSTPTRYSGPILDITEGRGRLLKIPPSGLEGLILIPLKLMEKLPLAFIAFGSGPWGG